MPFVGQAEATIDKKQRLAIPAKFRARWSAEIDGPTWCCLPWPADGVLRLYPEKTFEALFAAGRGTPSLTPRGERAKLDRLLFSATEQLDVDAQHRVRLPAWQLEKLEIPSEVVVLGAGDRLEVRARAGWTEDFDQGLGELEQLAAMLDEMNNRG